MAQQRYTKEQHAYLLEIIPGRYNEDAAELFQKKFGIPFTANQLKSYKANHKLKSGLTNKRRMPQKKLFSPEQEHFIRENLQGISNKELTDKVNGQFGTAYAASQIKAFKQRNKLSNGLDRRFEKGHKPHNQGIKGVYNVGGNSGSFQKGHRPVNYKPVGYERVNDEGYLMIKVSDEGAWHERWKHKHKVIWEAKHGPVPENHCLIFLDQNKLNVSLENLQLISRAQLSRLNQNHLISNNPEITKTGIVIANIYSKIGSRKRNSKKGGE